MNQHTADNRPESREGPAAEPEPTHHDVTATDAMPERSSDPLDAIEDELERLPGVDPAESVAVLAEITATLNREIDADQETS